MKNITLLCVGIIGIGLLLPLNSMANTSHQSQQITEMHSQSPGVGIIPPGGQGKI